MEELHDVRADVGVLRVRAVRGSRGFCERRDAPLVEQRAHQLHDRRALAAERRRPGAEQRQRPGTRSVEHDAAAHQPTEGVSDEVHRCRQPRQHCRDVLGQGVDRVRRGILRTARLVLPAQVDGHRSMPGTRERTGDRRKIFLAAGVARDEEHRGTQRDVLRRLRHERRKVSCRHRDAFAMCLCRQLETRRDAHAQRLPTGRVRQDEPAVGALAGSSSISQTSRRGPAHPVISPRGTDAVVTDCRIIAVANQKGGVAKTTTVASVGAALAEMGRRVLVVDLDPQACLTFSLGLDPETVEISVHDVLLGRVSAGMAVHQTAEGPDVLPATIELAGCEAALLMKTGREYVLRSALDELRSSYDVILLDCAPSLGVLTLNALTAADDVLVPLQCESLSHRGVGQLLDTVHEVQRLTNRDLRVLGVLPTLFDARTTHARQVLADVSGRYGLAVIEPPIAKSVRFAEAPATGKSILRTAGRSPGAEAYRSLARRLAGVEDPVEPAAVADADDDQLIDLTSEAVPS